MKSRQSLLLCLIVSLLLLLNGVPLYAGVDEKCAELFQQDTIPKGENQKKIQEIQKKATDAAKKALPKVEPPKVEVPKDATNLFKKIAEAFKFRKHTQEKEKKRVLAIFEGLGINDSIAATSENIRILIDELSLRENQHYQNLLDVINSIKESSEKEAESAPAAPIKKIDEREDVSIEPSSSKVVTDKDIEDLTNKLLPLIAEKADQDEADKKKILTLNEIRKIRLDPDHITSVTDTVKHLIRKYTLKIKNIPDVYGMYNYNHSAFDADFKLDQINTLVYQSLFINGKSGNFKDLNGWDTAQIIDQAKLLGCKVIFTAAINQALSINEFLSNSTAINRFMDNVLYLLKDRKANGINIHFNNIPSQDGEAFASFVKFLSEVMKREKAGYQLLVTIPVHDPLHVYDMASLDEYVDRFIIDFSQLDPRSAGPIAPLKGKQDYSIKTSVARYLNADIPADKLIVSLPYSGTKWVLDKGSKIGRFLQYLTYSEIRSQYNWPVYYDDESANAVMDSLNASQVAVRRIWFDNEVSLEKKYDFILQNKLGGVGINALGYDRGYGELWDALSYKFATIDTLYQKDSLMFFDPHLNFLEKMQRRMSLYWYILKNPCKVCFDDIQDPVYAATITRYLQELRIDSLILVSNAHRKPAKDFKTRFEYINHELTRVLGFTTLLLLLIGLICAGIYVYEIKVNSVAWKWKKHGEGILIGLVILLVISFFTYLFSNDAIPLFGSTPKNVTEMSNPAIVIQAKPVAIVNTDTLVTQDTTILVTTVPEIDFALCVTEPDETCINMPLPTLMGIIIAGMLIGLLLTRYLILPLIRRNDIP